ncbi:protocatechuate 3,4-dioxygenase [Paraburkholderia sp. J12]|uniref:DODA-type extradiol aromatic ring-opening family dioxygenase n=1 Tax=Paraburkholderia sp. J12 TaxID=2805432 RepID=UPI002ABE30AA|nr:protocatechuate 3,4-dioxygenase [Paraburkholderia sp. J12]
MARIVLGLGASHTPLLTLDSEQWVHRAQADYANKRLNLSDGRWLSYDELLAEVGPKYAEIVTADELVRKAHICEASLDQLADELEAANPDVVVIVGDDQAELFGPANQPAFAVFHGREIVTMDKYGVKEAPEWVRTMGEGYLMDEVHRVPAASDLGLHLVGQLVDGGVDVTSVASVEKPSDAGFGHAFGFIIQRLFRGKSIPVLPVLLNTYYPPNVPTAARCHDIGRAVEQALARHPDDLRVAIIASGGLSHFVVDEELDRCVISALKSGDHTALRSIGRGALNSGSSEILNWVLTAGAVEKLSLAWVEYQPLYRTPAGTGVGAAFAVWRE